MKLLSIDASGKSAACAVTDGHKVICEELTNTGLTHSQTLLPMVEQVLKKACIDIEDIDEFAITCGPGSFTGLRIGMALCMGLAGNKPCRAVPTLTALAYNLCDRDGIIIPAMDARRNQVYTAIFESKNGVITQLKEDCAIAVDEVLESIKEYADKQVWIVGDGAYLFKEKVTELTNVDFPEDEYIYPLGRSIARAAEFTEPKPARELKLSYLRMSQAERELKERLKK